MRTALEGVTPELSDVIRTLIDAVLVNVNVCLPAKIVEYDSKTQYATVQVQLLKKYEDGAKVQVPNIASVPVKHPRSSNGAARIHMPIKPGDDVLLVFSQRSIDNWKIQGGMSDPADRRKFSISDAFALIGGSAEPDAFPVEDPTAIEMVNGDSTLQVFADGTFNVKNKSHDLIKELVGLAGTLSGISTIAGGPLIPTDVAAINARKANLETLQGP